MQLEKGNLGLVPTGDIVALARREALAASQEAAIQEHLPKVTAEMCEDLTIWLPGLREAERVARVELVGARKAATVAQSKHVAALADFKAERGRSKAEQVLKSALKVALDAAVQGLRHEGTRLRIAQNRHEAAARQVSACEELMGALGVHYSPAR